ncbi:hypothetical protein NDU88_001810 [Pleurodeles waltl]|uniref:Heat shock factor binding protein 1 n=1 Tax=Pleurodeles waltl TaxID=8319 RepID=A0AAV7TIU2_PLEWA|nr:hypothetical protein NDU88_001810 [Pleurodeles waltl]
MEEPAGGGHGTGAPSASSPDVTPVIMTKLNAGFQAIDLRLDTLATRLDRMNELIDRHATRLDGTERQISEVEDSHTDTQK